MSILRNIVVALVAAATLAIPLALAQSPVTPRNTTPSPRDVIGPDVVRYCGPLIQQYARAAGEDAARREVTSVLTRYFSERKTIGPDGRQADLRSWNDEAMLYSAVGSATQYADGNARMQMGLTACLLGRAITLSAPDSGYLAVSFKGDLGGTIYRILGAEKHMLCTGTMEWRPCFVQLRANETYELRAEVTKWVNDKSRPVGEFSKTITMKPGESEVWMPAEGQ